MSIFPWVPGAGGADAATAETTPYTADAPGDWDVEPENVADGLDELAGRVSTVEDTAAVITAVTVSTGNVGSGNSADIDVPIPGSATAATIEGITVTRTAGAADSFTLSAYTDDARTDVGGNPSNGYLMGGSFDNIAIGADPVHGPRIVISGAPQFLTIPYVNTDDSAFIRARLTNASGSAGTFDVTLAVLPRP